MKSSKQKSSGYFDQQAISDIMHKFQRQQQRASGSSKYVGNAALNKQYNTASSGQNMSATTQNASITKS